MKKLRPGEIYIYKFVMRIAILHNYLATVYKWLNGAARKEYKIHAKKTRQIQP